MTLTAGHSESQFFPYPVADSFNAALSAASQIGTVKSYDIRLGRIVVRTPMSMKSWGEDLIIQLLPVAGGAELRINSGSRLQMVDWGKNRENIDKFISLMAACLRQAPQAQTGDNISSQAHANRSEASFCCVCGARLAADGKFCSSCGQPVRGTI
jgi:hypothetical protein